MTDCINTPACGSMTFSAFGKQPVLADFNGGPISADGGAMLLRMTEERIGIVGKFAAAMDDPRRPEFIEHDMSTMIGQCAGSFCSSPAAGRGRRRSGKPPHV